MKQPLEDHPELLAIKGGVLAINLLSLSDAIREVLDEDKYFIIYPNQFGKEIAPDDEYDIDEGYSLEDEGKLILPHELSVGNLIEIIEIAGEPEHTGKQQFV